MSTNTVLGAVGVLPVGEWSSANTYNRLDIVTYQGSSYVAIDDVPLNTLPTNTTYWQLMAHKGDTGNGIVSIEMTSTVGNVDTYTITYTNGDTDTIEVTNGNVSSVNGRTGAVTGLAESDGYYEQMTVGNAEQLVSTVFVEDSVPYNFRTSGGSADIGDREYDAVVGGTVAWNQIQANTGSKTASGTTYSYSDGILTVKTAEGGATGNSWWLDQSSNKWDWIKDHVYFIDVGNPSYIYTSGVISHWYIATPTATNIPKASNIIKMSQSINNYLQYVVYNGNEVDITFKPQVFDLTQMFGSTIADYIYTLEQNTPGAGVAWFRKLFPKDYYAYNAGQLMSVKTSAHNMVGFNAYDNTTGKAKVVGGQQYQITGTYTALSLGGVTITPDADGYFTPTQSGELTVTGGNATDICVHLVWDGERDGEYEPYELHSYPLDSDLELRGIPKLDSNNKLYYDGDLYESDGTVTRRYGIVDLGTLNWQYQTQGQLTLPRFAAALPAPAPASPYWSTNNILSTAKYTRGANIGQNSNDIYWGIAQGTVYFTDSSYTDAATFKTAMSGVYLVYELATPTTESADAFGNPQIVNDFGTEEYVDSRAVPIPVGHNTKYANNLRAKLEMMPESPSGDGDYIVRQTDGENAYVALSSNATVSGLTTRCPVCPSDTDGTYVLKATVSDGAVVYSWEAQA